MIQVTFNVYGPTERPNPEELREDLSQVFAGDIRVVDCVVLDDKTPERNLPA